MFKFSFRKRGQFGGVPEGIIGMTLGVLIVVTLLFIGSTFWDLFVSTGGIDSTSYNSFNGLVGEILDMESTGENKREVPVQFDNELFLVAFSSNDATTGSCVGMNIYRASKNCNGACVCVCDTNGGEHMCNMKKTVCRDFQGSDIDFVGCNVVEGTGNPQKLSIEKTENGFLFRTTS